MQEFMQSPLFAHMTEEEVKSCIACAGGGIREFKKDEVIFSQLDKPYNLYILISGSVSVCKTTLSGKQSVVVTFENAGDIFGEVYVFLGKERYDYDAIAGKNVRVLEFPQRYFYQSCQKSCHYHQQLIQNMLNILAHKAYYLNKKLQILSSGTLRQKIGSFLLENSTLDKVVSLPWNREQFADFLHVARPSLSRELIHMQEEGLIQVEKNRILILDELALEDEL